MDAVNDGGVARTANRGRHVRFLSPPTTSAQLVEYLQELRACRSLTANELRDITGVRNVP
jgi:hypothetical protein